MKADSDSSVWFKSEDHLFLVDDSKPVEAGDLVVDLNASDESGGGLREPEVRVRQLGSDDRGSVVFGKATHIGRFFPFNCLSPHQLIFS